MTDDDIRELFRQNVSGVIDRGKYIQIAINMPTFLKLARQIENKTYKDVVSELRNFSYTNIGADDTIYFVDRYIKELEERLNNEKREN